MIPRMRIGREAPEFRAAAFLQGNPITGFLSGLVHLVELWTDGCGSRRFTGPLLTRMQQDFPGVCFVSLFIDPLGTRPQVDSSAYRECNLPVARDFADTASEVDDYMLKHWYEPSNASTLPICFIVDGNGKLAWWGSISDAENPLRSVVNGTWDLDAEAARRDEKQHIAKVRAAALDGSMAASGAGDWESALRHLEDAVARCPSLQADRDVLIKEIESLQALNRREAAHAVMQRLLANSTDQALLSSVGAYLSVCGSRDADDQRWARSLMLAADRLLAHDGGHDDGVAIRERFLLGSYIAESYHAAGDVESARAWATSTITMSESEEIHPENRSRVVLNMRRILGHQQKS